MEPAFLSQSPGVAQRLATLLFSGTCVNCKKPVESSNLGSLCRDCWKGVRFLKGNSARRRGSKDGFECCLSAGAFEGALREAVHAYKFGGKTSFMRPFLELLEAIAPRADLLCWPPTAAASLKERGFDSTAELARSLGKRLQIPLYSGLRRVRQGEKQASLGRQERWLNAKGAFEAAGGPGLQGRHVLLVDDVITTGATLSECASALLRAGAESVHGIALASGELRGN